jgi:TatA/E family protein of Tat protein translocase
MFGIGLPELMVILVVALLVFGPTKLPELARSLGRASSDLRQSFADATEEPRIERPPPKPPSAPLEDAPSEPEAGQLEEVGGPPPAAGTPEASPEAAKAVDVAEPSEAGEASSDPGEKRSGG